MERVLRLSKKEIDRLRALREKLKREANTKPIVKRVQRTPEAKARARARQMQLAREARTEAARPAPQVQHRNRACIMLGISRSTAIRYEAEGILLPIKYTSKKTARVYYSQENIDALIRAKQRNGKGST